MFTAVLNWTLTSKALCQINMLPNLQLSPQPAPFALASNPSFLMLQIFYNLLYSPKLPTWKIVICKELLNYYYFYMLLTVSIFLSILQCEFKWKYNLKYLQYIYYSFFCKSSYLKSILFKLYFFFLCKDNLQKNVVLTPT